MPPLLHFLTKTQRRLLTSHISFQLNENRTSHWPAFCRSEPLPLSFSILRPLFCLPLCIINLHPICHEIPHLLDTQKGRLCLFFIWTVGDGARCLAAAECSGVTVLVTGHDEQAQMKDEAWRIFGKRGTPRPAPSRIPCRRRPGETLF